LSSTLNRRDLLRRAGAAAGGGVLSAVALERMTARTANAKTGTQTQAGLPGENYGPLAPVADQRGLEILALPAGFSYVTFGHIGSRMSDGALTPIALDGMAAFPDRGSRVRLVRNHEDRNPAGKGTIDPGRQRAYDNEGTAGTTTLIFDTRKRELVADYVSLHGTTVNCAGGIAYGGRAWLTGEETVRGPDAKAAREQFPERHGYVFEVSAYSNPRYEYAPPIKAMGRFAHEAVAVDQRTGIVYETEDAGTGRGSGFYRYLPEDPRNLHAGGKLEMLAVRGLPGYDTRKGQTVGDRLAVTWVDIKDVDPVLVSGEDPNGVFFQGLAGGGAVFNRLEGCWYDEGSIYFVSTSGGDVENGDVNSDGYREGFGQVWEYRPSARNGGTLELIFESPGGDVLDSPDNLTVTPRGGLILCEDDASSDSDISELAPGIEDVNRLIGLTSGGDAFPLAVNRLNDAELAGACFSPDGDTLFVNILGGTRGTSEELKDQGMTCAITGPWEQGPL